ncbi:hypothetical protein BJF79_08595 [Actinomadura sp. CNU-125]|uniref:DUF397 domain-containing protein n=1 Tax=Actinomadura sp. CNU-125 TaxID=1904961 RepID=UPI000969FCCB|nr:DUF397 domain-containing protein [Actinomadura sp. CNU-125]OLT31843.1 hypothetical protein BJF79_08595 [Actinomadura sp. CNU-125]
MINSGASSRPVWRKSSHSGGGNQCVEVAWIGVTRAVRDSKNPEAGHLTFLAEVYETFIGRVKNGEFDL